MIIASENRQIPGSIIDGKQGELEAIIDKPPEENLHFVAICCHPHPQHGGAMGNKVIYTASRALASLGIVSIRFNFRGVGKSDGVYADGIGEQDDLKAAVIWALGEYPDRKIILAGFSFGARISAMQAVALNASLLLSIAPPIGRIDFNGFERPNCPWLVVQGDDDELVVADQVAEWVNEFENKPELFRMPATTHFFHGKLTELRAVVSEFTQNQLLA